MSDNAVPLGRNARAASVLIAHLPQTPGAVEFTAALVDSRGGGGAEVDNAARALLRQAHRAHRTCALWVAETRSRAGYVYGLIGRLTEYPPASTLESLRLECEQLRDDVTADIEDAVNSDRHIVLVARTAASYTLRALAGDAETGSDAQGLPSRVLSQHLAETGATRDQASDAASDMLRRLPHPSRVVGLEPGARADARAIALEYLADQPHVWMCRDVARVGTDLPFSATRGTVNLATSVIVADDHVLIRVPAVVANDEQRGIVCVDRGADPAHVVQAHRMRNTPGLVDDLVTAIAAS